MTRWTWSDTVIVAVAVAILVGTALYEREQRVQAQGMTSAGVVIRTDGTVLIDPWVFYPSTPPAPPGMPAEGVKAPTKVILGELVPDSVMICREGPLGSRCKPLGTLLPKLKE